MTALQSSLARALHGSPLRRPLVGIAVCLLLVLALLIAASGLLLVFFGATPAALGVFAVALLIDLIVAVPALLIVRYLDRREPEPPWLYAGALLWGGLMATGLAGVLNVITASAVGVVVTASFFGPIYEETTKGLALLIIFWLLRDEFDGIRDGLIYGALVGLGFNIAEAAVYVAQGFQETGLAPFAQQIAGRFVLLGFNGHALWTALVGAGLGVAYQTNRRWLRVVAPVAFYLMAVIGHMAANTIGAIVVSITGLLFGAALRPELVQQIELGNFDLASVPWFAWWAGNLAGALTVQFPFYIALGVLLLSSRDWERQVIQQQLADEVSAGAVTLDEYAAIRAGRPLDGTPQARVIASHQAELALRKWRLARDGRPIDGDPIVAAWRADIAGLRET